MLAPATPNKRTRWPTIAATKNYSLTIGDSSRGRALVQDELSKAPRTIRQTRRRLGNALSVSIDFQTAENHIGFRVPWTTCVWVDRDGALQAPHIVELGRDEDGGSALVLCMANLPSHILRTVHWHIAAIIEKTLQRPWENICAKAPLVPEAHLGTQQPQAREVAPHRYLEDLAVVLSEPVSLSRKKQNST